MEGRQGLHGEVIARTRVRIWDGISDMATWDGGSVVGGKNVVRVETGQTCRL